MPPNLLSDADLHELFSALDKDTSGDVSWDELRSFVREADVGSGLEGSESSELSDPQPETAMASTSEHHSGGSSNVAIFRTGSTVSYNPMLTPASHGPDAASNEEGANLQKELAEAVDGFPTTIYVSSFAGFLAAHSVIGSVKDVDLDQAQRAAAEKLLAAEFRLKTEGVVKGVTISIDTERKLFALVTFGNAIAAKLARFMVRTNMFDTHPLSQSILWFTF